VSLLLPQEVAATVRGVRPLDIHGDRYVDVSVETDDTPPRVLSGRVPASECPGDLAVGERVSARFMMGVMVRVKR
jgi:hypothetical protein